LPSGLSPDILNKSPQDSGPPGKQLQKKQKGLATVKQV
jgi:hypothetical protein